MKISLMENFILCAVFGYSRVYKIGNKAINIYYVLWKRLHYDVSITENQITKVSQAHE